MIDQQNNNVGQAHRADRILRQAGFAQSDPLTEIVVIQSKTLTIHDAAFRAVAGDVVRTVAPFTQIHNLRSPLTHRDQISRDGRTALVEWDMRGTLRSAEKRIDRLTQAVASVANRNPGFYVWRGGLGEHGQDADQAVHPAAVAGGRPVGAVDAGDLGARVRVAVGGVGAADARPPSRDRDDGDHEHHQPHHPDGPERPVGRVADRTRGRR